MIVYVMQLLSVAHMGRVLAVVAPPLSTSETQVAAAVLQPESRNSLLESQCVCHKHCMLCMGVLPTQCALC
jgi:hypothetical protein